MAESPVPPDFVDRIAELQAAATVKFPYKFCMICGSGEHTDHDHSADPPGPPAPPTHCPYCGKQRWGMAHGVPICPEVRALQGRGAAEDEIAELLHVRVDAIVAVVKAAEALYSADAPRSYDAEFSRRSAALLEALETLNRG